MGLVNMYVTSVNIYVISVAKYVTFVAMPSVVEVIVEVLNCRGIWSGCNRPVGFDSSWRVSAVIRVSDFDIGRGVLASVRPEDHWDTEWHGKFSVWKGMRDN